MNLDAILRYPPAVELLVITEDAGRLVVRSRRGLAWGLVTGAAIGALLAAILLLLSRSTPAVIGAGVLAATATAIGLHVGRQHALYRVEASPTELRWRDGRGWKGLQAAQIRRIEVVKLPRGARTLFVPAVIDAEDHAFPLAPPALCPSEPEADALCARLRAAITPSASASPPAIS